MDNGFEIIVVVRTRPVSFRRPAESARFSELSERFYKNYPKLTEQLLRQSEQYNHACDELEKLQDEGRIMMLCPSSSIVISTLEGDMEKLGALYLLGRCDAKLMLPQLKQYLGLDS